MSRLLTCMGCQDEAIEKICILGMQGSGKTTLLHKYMSNSADNINSETGVYIQYKTLENIQINGNKYWAYDCKWKPNELQRRWKSYYEISKGIIFVVNVQDILNEDILNDIKGELIEINCHMTNKDNFCDIHAKFCYKGHIPIFIFINKSDKYEGKKNINDLVIENLEIEKFKLKNICVKWGDVDQNFNEFKQGLGWLDTMININKKEYPCFCSRYE